MINNITTIKQDLNKYFYTADVIDEIKKNIEVDLDAKVDSLPGQIQFRISKKTAKANGFKFNDSSMAYGYIESLLLRIYGNHTEDLKNLGIDYSILSNNIPFMYRLNVISGNTFILEF